MGAGGRVAPAVSGANGCRTGFVDRGRPRPNGMAAVLQAAIQGRAMHVQPSGDLGDA